MIEKTPYSNSFPPPDPGERFAGPQTPQEYRRLSTGESAYASDYLDRLRSKLDDFDSFMPDEADYEIWKEYSGLDDKPDEFVGRLGLPVKVALLAVMRSEEGSLSTRRELSLLVNEAAGADNEVRNMLDKVVKNQDSLFAHHGDDWAWHDSRHEQRKYVDRLLDQYSAHNSQSPNQYRDMRLFLNGIALGVAEPNLRPQYQEQIMQDL